MILGWLFAFLAALFYTLMNLFDKFVMMHRANSAKGFAIVAGMVLLLFGVILALFISTLGAPAQYIFPVIAGILLGIQFFVYYDVIEKVDVSHGVGLVYTYPVLLAGLSYLFIGETLSWIGYLGIAIIVLGAVLLSIRMQSFKLDRHAWPLAFMIVLIALYELALKLSAESLPVVNGVAATMVAAGITIMSALVVKANRDAFRADLKNIRWAFLTELLSISCLGSIYLAMTKLPATIVAGVGAMEPMLLVFFEYAIQDKVGKMVKDTALLPKLGAITLIVVGVVLLYLS